jgi:hypothetical protein
MFLAFKEEPSPNWELTARFSILAGSGLLGLSPLSPRLKRLLLLTAGLAAVDVIFFFTTGKFLLNTALSFEWKRGTLPSLCEPF